MFTVLKNAQVVSSKGVEKQDVVMCGEKVVYVGKDPKVPASVADMTVETVDVAGGYVLPGLIDGHCHFQGASGEAGPHTRAPEIPASAFAAAGVTTVVGLMGMDSFSRNVEGLIAKTRALAYEGLSAYCMTGSYQMPPATCTGSVARDIYLIPEVIGVGEVAVSDHRSSSPTVQELRRMVKDAGVAAMAKGIKGSVVFHVGNEKDGMTPVVDLLKGTDIDPATVIVTHVNRNERLMKEAMKYTDTGFWMDITTIYFDKRPDGFYHAEDAIERLLSEKPQIIDRLTASSDCGCAVENDSLTQPSWLYRAFTAAAASKKVGLARAVRIFMENPATALGMKSKGHVATGYDADVIVTDKAYRVKQVYSKGRRIHDSEQSVQIDFYKKGYR